MVRVAPWLLGVTVIATFAWTATFPLLHGWDDNVYVTNNTARLVFNLPNVVYWFTHDCVACYLPLTMISYMADYAVWGLNPVGYHLQNLFWHVIAVVGVCLCFRRLGAGPAAAVLGAWLFAIHPQRVESVVWVSERKDVLCAACYFMALAAYLRARERSGFPGVSFVLFVCAMLSKSMAISLPVVLLVVELRDHLIRGVDGRGHWRSVVRRLWPFFLVALVFVPVTIAFQSIPAGESSWWRQGAVALYTLPWYMFKTLVPMSLCPIYPRIEFTPWVTTGLVLLYLVGALLIWLAWRHSRALLLQVILPFFLCYALALLPVSGIVPLGYVDMSDRYSYIPSAFVLLGAILCLQASSVWARQSCRVRLFALAGVLGVGGLLVSASVTYASHWRDIHSLTRLACQRRPANVFALGQLGDIELDAGNAPEVLALGLRLVAADRSWMTPEARERTLQRGLYMQGFALYLLGQTGDALAAFERIESTLHTRIYHLPTGNAAVWAMMADGYLQQGNTARALACYRALLRQVPRESFEEQFYRGLLAQHSGKAGAAASHFEAALRLRPGHPLAQAHLDACRPSFEQEP